MAHSDAQVRALELQAELLAEQQADQLEAVFSSTLYQQAFNGPSLGTEEELQGASIKMRMTAARVIGVVSKGDTPLVLITRDMRIRPLDGDYREYTIELRTTPTEVPGPNMLSAPWEDRRRALQVAIWAIDTRTDSPLANDDWRGFQTYIRNADHSFVKSSSIGITGSDKQATFGIPASAIVAASRNDREKGQLHPHVQVPWYLDEFIADTAVTHFATPEQVAYAFLMSAALKLTRLPRDNNELYLFRAPVKDAWRVRPRTPPIKILDIFTDDRKDAVRRAFKGSPPPAFADPPTAEDWSKYVEWILDGRSLGGHTPPDSTVNGAPAMLFEYRTAPVDRYPYAFWRLDEWTTDTF